MWFKNVSTMALICVLMAFLGIIEAKAEVSMDPDRNDTIIVGPDKRLDWVVVSCTTRYIRGTIINDYCDKGPILSLTQDIGNVWLVRKKHSLWAFYAESKLEESSLVLLNHD